ncbi:hypothetical protein M8998_15555 [Sphingobacterium sp. lm-10]|uniref:hypothetical protein n=1 Tax=Sphingobacterium sp. lm-10 TaxID=2944904 RepID=UPI0020229AE9|nr:hypothetical protein [Sphingobacterium sp. lm-10]MCL7989367.1 hypothetical protein [Sphingobacterium sp. lm-10]
MKYILFSLKLMSVATLLFLISSCSKDTPLELENEIANSNSWTSDERFEYHHKTQLYATKIGNRLAMIGPYGYTNLYPSEQDVSQETADIKRYAIYFQPSINVKLPISEQFFVGASMQHSTVLFVNSDLPVSTGLSKRLDVRDIDPEFNEMVYIHSHFGESMAINNRNQTLMAYRANGADNYPFMRLLLVDVDPGGGQEGIPTWLNIPATKVIALDDREHYGLDMIMAIEDHFLISSHTRTLLVDSDGNYRQVLDRALVRTFEHNSMLYGFGRDGNFYQSADKGNSWMSSYDVERFLSDVSFSQVGDQLVGYRYGQIWKFNFHDSGYEVEELVNEGLTGNLITSLNEFDDKVYVTTLSGVYHKPKEQFFEVKPKEAE